MSMMTEQPRRDVHVIPADQLTTEYAVVFREFGEYEDTVTPVDAPDHGEELIADLWNNLGIKATLTYRLVTTRAALPAIGDTVRYTGTGETRRLPEYTVATLCHCWPCAQDDTVFDRFEIRRVAPVPGHVTPAGLSHVHATHLEIMSRPVTGEDQ